ncbi:MAG TPA: hypothetical protein VE964_17165, partial [Myxococcales bacterium]|nr:hypothetical protein [Myxococcales bacterium]
MGTTIIDLLQRVQVIDDRAHDAVMSRARSHSGGHIVQQIAELGLATESSMARTISVELGLPRIDLQMTPPEPAALALLDARVCAERFVLPVALRENGELLWLAMADPTDEDAIALVQRRTQKRIRPAVAGPSEILRAVRQLYEAPAAGAQHRQPEEPPADKLAAIVLEDDQASGMELVGLQDDSARPPTRRQSASRRHPSPRGKHPKPIEIPEEDADDRPQVSHATPPRPVPRIPPATPAPPTRKNKPAPATESESTPEPLFTTTAGGPIGTNDLTDDDLASLDALRHSLEQAALVMRAVAELCVEKGVLSLKEVGRKKS